MTQAAATADRDTATADGGKSRFTPAFLEELRARTPLHPLIGRDVRLTRKGNLWSGLCPFHGEQRPSFAVYADHYHCFGCGVHGDAIRYIMDRRGVSFVEAVKELAQDAGMIGADGEQRTPMKPIPPPAPDPAQQNNADAMKIFRSAEFPIFDTPVEDYLKNRKIDLRPLNHAPGALRFHPGLYHGGIQARLPAMVAAINDAAGHLVAIHRTWLERTGGGWIKARIPDNKMVLGRFAGGSIHLWKGGSDRKLKDAPQGDPVFIGEGIETCLSVVVAVPELRVLSGVSLGNLGSVDLPPQIGKVILGLENDVKPAAVAAQTRVLNRWIARGFNVRVARSALGNDFNDWLQGV